MKHIWIDIDEATGKYDWAEGDEPRFISDEEMKNDLREGTTALVVEFDDDLSTVRVPYYDAEIEVKAAWINGQRIIGWKPLLCAALALSDEIEDEDHIAGCL